jgi:hypothetical protein
MINGKIYIEHCPHILGPTVIDKVIKNKYSNGTKLEYMRSLRIFNSSSMCIDDVLNNYNKYLTLIIPTIPACTVPVGKKSKAIQFLYIARVINEERTKILKKLDNDITI